MQLRRFTQRLAAMLVLAFTGCVGAPDGAPDGSVDDTVRTDGTSPPRDVASDTVRPDTAGCPPMRTNCAGACLDLLSDPSNCGACGMACAAGQVCNAGACSSTCTLSTCSNGTATVCVDTRSDPSHCGSCARACPSGWICGGGVCACPTGTLRCGLACVDPMSDAANCGTCGHACAGGQSCSTGVCTGGSSCTGAGQMMCSGGCVDVRSSASNCGACGSACGAGQSCINGACAGGPTCTGAGQMMCGGSCVDVRSSTSNCGSCSNACRAGQTCSNGTCSGGSSCTGAGQMQCGGSCIDVRSSASNCGGCGTVCPSGWACQASQCAWTDMLNAVNAARAQARTCGMYGPFAAAPPLTWESRLAMAAAGHSMVMDSTPCFSHDGTGTTPCPDGNPCRRITATGYTWMSYGENIAAGQQTVAEVMASWLMSPGHCRNIMDPTFTQFGAAMVRGSGPYGIYWTQNFGTPGGAGPSSCP